ncbi:class I SAM-dependent methyltransferase [Nocardia sp. CDC159]|uniref:Class I SAM-dependent methyltransferase n=1 Tax=Nocardia pulmonis TaxID=2951408 RepID=A0A9X2J041_9NOCA|nr:MULTISPECIES: class I SAM-dependent methyltransferase [Nocardia]MCM6775616.1 class I SAM-dependent methyltransferase [Nocardia pulmonis]MCM6787650.1 class I SAM-dependent methyltransferase [Nocardia sp. CDC159]
MDSYADTAEFYDIAGRSYWKPRAATLTKALSGAAGGPIVDIGAGTGLVVELLGAALPAAEFIAVEPSAAMRAALIGRLLNRPELAARVTVVPETIEAVALPERLGGAVACGVLGYLDPERRRELWRMLARRLAPGARAVVEAIPFPPTRVVRPIRVGAARFGERTHEIWLGSEPAATPGRIELTTLCRVRAGDRVLRECVSRQEWFAVDMNTIVTETAAAGLCSRRTGWDLAALWPEGAARLDARTSSAAESINR